MPFKVKKRIYYLIPILLFICLIAGIIMKNLLSAQTAKNDIPLVRTQPVHVGSSSQSFQYSGEVRSRYESQLAFQVNGKIISRNVEVGSTIHAGDVLMQIDPSDAQQSVESYAAQVASAESACKLVHDSLKRCQELYEQGAVSKVQLDQTQNSCDTADASLRQLQAAYALSQNQLQYTSLRADRNGIVTSINAEVGQVIIATATAQPVITIAQDSNLEAEINVPENRIDNLRQAMQIKVTFWALPGVTLDGQVGEVSPVADNITRTFKVRIILTNPPPEVKLGMTATVSVAGLDNTSAIVNIPLAAVYQTGDIPQVWIVNNDTVNLRNIKIGKFEKDQVQVVEGLNEGDLVVIGGVHKLIEGQKVRTGDTQLE